MFFPVFCILFVHFIQDDELQEDKEEEEEKENRQNDESGTSTTDSETYSTTTRVIDVSTTTGRRLVQPRSPPPPPPPTEPAADNDDGGGPGSELARLRGRCRRLERSLQQLVNTELWARNRQIGKLEQQRYVTQVQQADAERRDRPPTPAAAQMTTTTTTTGASPSPTTKGILVKRSPEAAAVAAETVPQSITTPPPVLPDYSEVNFFFSCDEEEDDDDDDDDDGQGEEDWETNTLSSSSEEDCTDDRTGVKDGEPVGFRLPLVTSTPAALVRPRKRHCRRHHQRHRLSSSTESTVATGDYGGDATATTSTATVSRRRRRTRPRRYSSRCGRCGVGGGGAVAVADAQIQCESVVQAVDQIGGGDNDNDDQLSTLRRELDARRRENCRLYEMLLRLQRESGREKIDSDDDDDTISDRAGSPEPYKRAARAVQGRIADLLPPLLSMRSCGNTALMADGPHPAGDGNDCHRHCCEQQQQQLRLLTRLRERIVAYERQELHQLQSADAENAAVRHMDRAGLVNVALPRAVDRLRRALGPLLHEKPEERQRLAAAGDDDNVKPTTTTTTTADRRPF